MKLLICANAPLGLAPNPKVYRFWDNRKGAFSASIRKYDLKKLGQGILERIDLEEKIMKYNLCFVQKGGKKNETLI